MLLFGCLYVYGGIGPDSKIYDDMWKFNLTDNAWEEIKTQNQIEKENRKKQKEIERENQRQNGEKVEEDDETNDDEDEEGLEEDKKDIKEDNIINGKDENTGRKKWTFHGMYK